MAPTGNTVRRQRGSATMYQARHYVHLSRVIGDAWARSGGPAADGLNVKRLELLEELIIVLSADFRDDNNAFDLGRFLEAVQGSLLDDKRLKDHERGDLKLCVTRAAARLAVSP